MEPPLRKVDVLVVFSFSGGTLGLDARFVSCAFACLPVLCLFIFLLQKKSGDHFFCELKKIWEERRKSMETQTKSTKSVTGGQASFCPSTP